MPVLVENRSEFVKAVAALDEMQADIGFGTESASSLLESSADTTPSDGLEVSAVKNATLITESSVEAVVTGTTSEPRDGLDALAPSLDPVPSFIGEASLVSDDPAAPSLVATPLDASSLLAAASLLDMASSLAASSSLAALSSPAAALVAALPSYAASGKDEGPVDFPLSTTHSARHLLFREKPVQYFFFLILSFCYENMSSTYYILVPPAVEFLFFFHIVYKGYKTRGPPQGRGPGGHAPPPDFTRGGQ